MADPVEPNEPAVPSAAQAPPPAEPVAAETPADVPPARRPLRWRRFGLVAAALFGLTIIYYVVGMYWVNAIDDDPRFGEQREPPAGGSRSVAVAADLIQREIETHRWVANDPFFMPGYLLDNTPNYQQGIVAALSRFVLELTDEIARNRGSSEVDRDVEAAAGLLKYPGNVWVFNPAVSLAPTASSEQQYREAMNALRRYNERLSRQQAVFEPRSDSLMTTIDRIAADLGSSSASVARHLEEHAGLAPDFAADNLFYYTKGRLYAYLLLMQALQSDFSKVIEERSLGSVWTQTVQSLEQAVALQPWFVVNGSPDGQLLPSHLASQGFYLLRARTQLKEISNILLK